MSSLVLSYILIVSSVPHNEITNIRRFSSFEDCRQARSLVVVLRPDRYATCGRVQ